MTVCARGAFLGWRVQPQEAAGSLLGTNVFASRRGRADGSISYDPLPNRKTDSPYLGGGNPVQAATINGDRLREHLHAFERRFGRPANIVSVDFFNTSVGANHDNVALRGKPGEDLVDTVCSMAAARLGLAVSSIVLGCLHS